MKQKNLFLKLAKKYSFLYKPYLYYNIYIRNFKYFAKKSCSQVNEDLIVKNYFKDKKGFYIDIGCGHPYKDNNTALLCRNGWSGINIDLSKINIDLFNLTRPKDQNICAIISKKSEKIEYFVPNDDPLSVETTTSKKYLQFLKKIHNNVYQTKVGFSLTWIDIIRKYKLKMQDVDFVTIDIEGKDLEVLKSINISKMKPKIIMIEAPFFLKETRKKIKEYLKKNGYKIKNTNKLNLLFLRTKKN
mgnify:FL=1